MSWTDEKIDELKRLWAQGLTTVEIGKALGVSKNAVVGKAHRLGLKSRPSPIRRGEDDTPKPRAEPKRKAAAKPPKVAKVISVVDLTAHSCRWPIGDPKTPAFHFCGKRIVPGKPYCLDHCMVAYVGSSKGSREDSAA